jgi:hypothetical protein
MCGRSAPPLDAERPHMSTVRKESHDMKRLATIVFVTALAASTLVATSDGRTSSSAALRGTVGPGFTIALAKAGNPVKALRAGTYRLTVADRSAEHNFVLQHGSSSRQLTSVAFIGTKTVTVRLTRGTWRVFCAPHASVMTRTFNVGAASAAARDDRRGEAEPGDARQREPEPGDDHGGNEPGDDHGGR